MDERDDPVRPDAGRNGTADAVRAEVAPAAAAGVARGLPRPDPRRIQMKLRRSFVADRWEPRRDERHP